MKQRLKQIRAGFLASWVFLFISAFAPETALAGPSWQGDPATTFQRFDLSTSDETVTPDAATNPLGIAEAVIEAVVPPGSGWQDPNEPFTTPGINGGDGAWDLGPEGFITVEVPVSPTPPPGLSYDVEFHIEVIVYQGIVPRPGLAIDGHAITGFNESGEMVETDPPFGSYHRLIWTGTVAAAATETLTFLVEATASGAVVDSIEIHSRYILNKTPATVTLSGLNQLFDGNSKVVSTTTNPPGLTVNLTYEGNPAAPVGAGDYAVVGTIVDAIYEGSATGTLTIDKTSQAINFAPLSDSIATASVNLTAGGGGSGNAVTFAVTGGPAVIGAGNLLTFSGAGSVSITASQAGNLNYLAAPDVTRTFTVTRAAATVTLSGLSHTYDGAAKSAGATTTPPGLVMDFTYDGLPVPPTAAGNYTVVGTIDDILYEGSASGTLVIAKAAQVINFAAIPDQLVSSVVHLTASGGGSGNAVSFAVTAGPGSIASGTILTFSTAGTVSVTASQADGANHLAATDVTRTFAVDFSGYDAWRAAEYPGETDPLIIGVAARPFGQALPNGYRYFLGNVAHDPTVLTSLGADGGAWVFRHLRVEPAPSDTLTGYEWSTDLVDWNSDGETVGGVTVYFVVTPGTVLPDGRVPVEIRAVPGGAETDRLFVRLKLTVPVTLP